MDERDQSIAINATSPETGDSPNDYELQAVGEGEYKDGLPVISYAEYKRLYDTDVRAFGEEVGATFNFQGYIRVQKTDGYYPGGTGVFYRDVIATNGILKTDEHKGVHVGTDGLVEWNDGQDNPEADPNRERNFTMSGPGHVNEYALFVILPNEMSSSGGNSLSEDNMDTIPIRVFGLNPQIDVLARDKMLFIHETVVRYIENGGELDHGIIEDLVEALVRELAKVDSRNALQAAKRSLADSAPRQIAETSSVS